MNTKCVIFPMARQLRIVSLNVNGMKTSVTKRKQIFHWLKNHNPTIVMLQETHTISSDEAVWISEWDGHCVFSHGSTNSCGVTIMLDKKLSYNVHDIKCDCEGRYIIIDITLENRRLTLVNLYAPNEDTPSFFENIFDEADNIDNDTLIIGGDFNCILDNKIDKKGGRQCHSNRRSSEFLGNYLDEKSIVDIWRRQHPTQTSYTSHKKIYGQHIFSRIDYFLISFNLAAFVSKSCIKASILTDHSMILMEVKLEEQTRGAGTWKLNTSFLKDPDYVLKIQNTIRDVVSNNQNLDAKQLWEFIKMKVRGDSIEWASIKKKSRINILEVLNRRLNSLKTRYELNPNDILKRDITLVEDGIQEIIQKELDTKIWRNKLCSLENYEKPTKIFLSMEKANYNKKCIFKLQTDNGLIDEKDLVLRELTNYYRKIYASSLNNREEVIQIENYLNTIHIPSLGAEKQQSCEGLLTEKEVLLSLKNMKNNKTPGSDGLPADFYKIFWQDIKRPLIGALNKGYSDGELSDTQRSGILNLIPKKDKDVMLLKNWRPLTLLNCDYKLAAKSIASRFKLVLTGLINEDQSGFMKGRYIGENIFKLMNVMDYVDEENIPSMLVNIDFEKAFDSIEWSFILSTLRAFNFGEGIQKWIVVLYKNISSQITNNGWLCEKFYPERGVRQGCPLSPYLFLLCAEILACKIRQNNDIKGINIGNQQYKISQYADDTILFLRYTEESLKEAVNIFKDYQHYSGLRVNYDKTEIMPLGPIKNHFDILLPENNMIWHRGPISVLGIKIAQNIGETIELNFSPKLNKINHNIISWSKRKLSPYGKITVLNAFIMSQYIYLLSMLPSPSNTHLTIIQNAVFQFIWDNKPDKIQRNFLKQKKETGGLNVPDIFIKNKALKLLWVPRIVNGGNKIKQLLSQSLPHKSTDFLSCNLTKEDIKMVTKFCRNLFTKEILECWFEYTNSKPKTKKDILYQFIWLNSYIKIGGSVILYNDWYMKGIKFVHQLYTNNRFMTFTEFRNLYNININFVQYYGIITAINNTWRDELRDISEVDMQLEPTHINSLRSNMWTKLGVKSADKACKLICEKIIKDDIFLTQLTAKWKVYFPNICTEDMTTSFTNIYELTPDCAIRYFQYKLLHRILICNEKLYRWGIEASDLCNFCHEEVETICHIFFECEVSKLIWHQLKYYLKNSFNIEFDFSPLQMLLNRETSVPAIVNKICLIGKFILFDCRCKRIFPTLEILQTQLRETRKMEFQIYEHNRSFKKYVDMWRDLII